VKTPDEETPEGDPVPVPVPAPAAEERPRPKPRRANRIAAFQFLYLYETQRDEPPEELLLGFLERQEEDRAYYAFAEELVHGTLAHLAEIDATITRLAENWRLERIARVELALLRLAVHELLHRPDIPPVVTINEAVELAKEYGSPESGRFLNGILDRLSHELDRPLREEA
jgi:N utilization substance protein B